MPIPALDRRNSFAQQLFAPLPARYDRLAELLSFGQNGRWRRAMVDRIVQAGAASTILDVAAGTAGVSLQLADRTGARVIGADLTLQMLATGARNVAAAGNWLRNLRKPRTRLKLVEPSYEEELARHAAD